VPTFHHNRVVGYELTERWIVNLFKLMENRPRFLTPTNPWKWLILHSLFYYFPFSLPINLIIWCL
jgi:hypothetical protein